MASLMENGPKLEWTRDSSMYTNYLNWKKRCMMVFNSALTKAPEASKCEYLKYWMGTEALPLIERWENTGVISTEPIPPLEGEEGGDRPGPGHLLATFWRLLETEFKPKANKILSVMDLWSNKSKQFSQPLNEWITKV